jgi:hypothetical protein
MITLCIKKHMFFNLLKVYCIAKGFVFNRTRLKVTLHPDGTGILIQERISKTR